MRKEGENEEGKEEERKGEEERGMRRNEPLVCEELHCVCCGEWCSGCGGEEDDGDAAGGGAGGGVGVDTVCGG